MLLASAWCSVHWSLRKCRAWFICVHITPFVQQQKIFLIIKQYQMKPYA